MCLNDTLPAGERPSGATSRHDADLFRVGMVTCSHCFARHSAKIGATAIYCARVCIRDEANFTFVNGEIGLIFPEGDSAKLKRVAGQRVQIVAPNGGTITVASVAAGA